VYIKVKTIVVGVQSNNCIWKFCSGIITPLFGALHVQYKEVSTTLSLQLQIS